MKEKEEVVGGKERGGEVKQGGRDLKEERFRSEKRMRS